MVSGTLNRALVLLALARLTERELEEVFFRLQDLGPSGFSSFLKSYEREIRSRAATWQPELFESERYDSSSIQQVVQKIDDFRKREISVSVKEMTQMMRDVLRDLYPSRPVKDFDSKQGLRSWVRLMLEEFSPSEMIQAVAVLRERGGREFYRTWSLRHR